MRGGWRFVVAIWAAGLALLPSAALAQSTVAEPSSQPADAVGPRELQNFSLSGTVTKPQDETAAQPSTAAPAAPSGSQAAATTSQAPRRFEATAEPKTSRSSETSAASPNRAPAPRPKTPASLATSDLASAETPATSDKTVSQAVVSPAPAAMPASEPLPVTPEHSLAIWPWLLAALVLAGGMMLLFWRSRQRHAVAGGADFDLYLAPEPAAPTPPTARAAPAPAREPIPAPAPPAPAPPAPVPPKGPAGGGVVSSGLRPSVEMAIQPLRCIVEDHQVAVEFELELLNSGNAPARDVLVEAAIFNAGPMQDQEISAFMDQPVGAGERLDAILPLQRISLRTQVIAPREALQIFEAGGRQVFVPLIAFNALYRWNSNNGQTSVSYLLGRVTNGDKLAPFRVDLGPRVYRGLAARPLPLEVRR